MTPEEDRSGDRPSDDRPFAGLPAIVRLNEIRAERDISQAEMGRALECTQPTMSDVLAYKARLGMRRRVRAQRVYGVALDAWLTPEELGHDGDANPASHCEIPQAAQVSTGLAHLGTAPESRPAAQVNA